ncbi:hypothetical protein F4776DRAFT_668223 [Hypoxylon sp. NC0597]|nr:hypothetical protein F4776DRAFT_668223 [Hypoxylon sp. NC0597]
MVFQASSWFCKVRRWLQNRQRRGDEKPGQDVNEPSDERPELTFNLLREILEERDNNLQVAADKLLEAQLQNQALERILADMSQKRAQDDRLKEENLRLKGENKSMGEKIGNLVEENTQLQSAARDRESHIFSLLPYREDLTTYDAIRKYEDLVREVNDFVSDWTDSLLDSDKLQAESIQYAKSNPGAIREFYNYLYKWEGLYGATIQMRDIDQEILNAFILRYLWENVFSTVLCNSAANVITVLDSLEHAMDESTDPKPDIFCVKSWRAQAHHAMFAHPDTRKLRKEVQHKLSHNLVYMLGFVGREKNKAAFAESLSTKIIDPALRLHEKFLTSTNDFRLGMDHSFRPGQKFDGEVARLRRVRCVDVAKNYRNFIIDKLNPIPSVEDLRRNLHILCSTRPALIVTEVGQGRSLKKPTVICKEQVLVAWIEQDGHQELIFQQKHGLKSWLNRILSTLDSTRRSD